MPMQLQWRLESNKSDYLSWITKGSIQCMSLVILVENLFITELIALEHTMKIAHENGYAKVDIWTNSLDITPTKGTKRNSKCFGPRKSDFCLL